MNRRASTVLRTIAAVAFVAVASAATGPRASAKFSPGTSFGLKVTFRHQPPSGRATRAVTLLGRGVFTGARGRVDIDSISVPTTFRKGDFIIIQDSINYLIVRPSDTTVRKRNSPLQNPIEGITERLLSTTISTTALKIDFDTVSLAETINGIPTRHYRIEAEASFVTSGGTRQVRQTVTVEQWVAKVGANITNPFGARIRGLPEADVVRGDYREFINTLARANRVFGDAVALKTVTTTNFNYGGGLAEDYYQTVELFDLKQAEVDERQFMLPEQYARKKPPAR